MYFSQFPLMAYDSTGTNKDITVCVNLLKRVAVRTQAKSNAYYFDKYDIREGETPESIAFDLYGDSELHWIILFINDITDRYYGWPMTLRQFESFLEDKYTNINAVHHYEIYQSSGDTTKVINIGTLNTDYPSATAITNYEHEMKIQDELRPIKIMKVDFIDQFVSEFSGLIEGSSF